MSPLKINGPHTLSPRQESAMINACPFSVVTTNCKVGKECHPVNWELGAVRMGALLPCASRVNHVNNAFVFSSAGFDYLIGARHLSRC